MAHQTNHWPGFLKVRMASLPPALSCLLVAAASTALSAAEVTLANKSAQDWEFMTDVQNNNQKYTIIRTKPTIGNVDELSAEGRRPGSKYYRIKAGEEYKFVAESLYPGRPVETDIAVIDKNKNRATFKFSSKYEKIGGKEVNQTLLLFIKYLETKGSKFPMKTQEMKNKTDGYISYDNKGSSAAIVIHKANYPVKGEPDTGVLTEDELNAQQGRSRSTTRVETKSR